MFVMVQLLRLMFTSLLSSSLEVLTCGWTNKRLKVLYGHDGVVLLGRICVKQYVLFLIVIRGLSYYKLRFIPHPYFIRIILLC